MEDNPYQAPEFIEPLTLGGSSVSEKEIRAFVGRNAGYYLRKWPGALDGPGRAQGFNWAAFLLSMLWLPYRKMYRIAFLVCGIFAAEEVVGEIAVARGLVGEQQLLLFDRVAGLVFWILCGAFANAWYLAHTKREIARIRALDLQDDAYYAALARRGGTSLLGSFGIILLFIVVMGVAAVAIDLLFPTE